MKRNIDRFSADFMFELSEQEYRSLKESLRSQTVILETDGRGKYPKYAPFAFTEIGVAMLSSVLRSEKAISMNRSIMRAFVAIRNYFTTTKTISAELAEIRSKLTLLERNDEDNAEAINDLSEDTRKELDNIYEAIAALSVKLPQARKSRDQSGSAKRRSRGCLNHRGRPPQHHGLLARPSLPLLRHLPHGVFQVIRITI